MWTKGSRWLHNFFVFSRAPKWIHFSTFCRRGNVQIKSSIDSRHPERVFLHQFNSYTSLYELNRLLHNTFDGLEGFSLCQVLSNRSTRLWIPDSRVTLKTSAFTMIHVDKVFPSFHNARKMFWTRSSKCVLIIGPLFNRKRGRKSINNFRYAKNCFFIFFFNCGCENIFVLELRSLLARVAGEVLESIYGFFNRRYGRYLRIFHR